MRKGGFYPSKGGGRMRTADSDVAAGSFVDVIRDIVKQDGETDDSLVLCQVAS